MSTPLVLRPTNSSYAVQRIQQYHHEMVRLALLGLQQKEIAQVLGVSVVTVHNVLTSPIVQQKMAMLQSQADGATLDVMEALQEDAMKSLNLLKEVRDAEDAPINLRVQVACDLLSRAGFGRVQKVQAAVAHGYLTPERIEEIKARARKPSPQQEPAEAEFQEIAA